MPQRKLLRLAVSLPIFIMLFCFNLQHAEARIEGTVRGRITVGNNRFSVNEVSPPSPLPIVSVRRVIVSVRALGVATNNELNPANPTFLRSLTPTETSNCPGWIIRATIFQGA